MKSILCLLILFSTTALATPVNINQANAQVIADALNGIGIKKAEAIVAYREKNGDFKTVDSLTVVSGIGEKTLEKNKADILLTDDKIIVDKPASTKEIKPKQKQKK